MTNSTTGIGTVKLVSNREGEIMSIGHGGVYWRMEVLLLPLTYAPLNGQRFSARPARSIQTGAFRCHRPIVYFLSLQCCINRQTQYYRPNIPVLHSALLHVSAVHITHRFTQTINGLSQQTVLYTCCSDKHNSV